jgi:hypothetical protein
VPLHLEQHTAVYCYVAFRVLTHRGRTIVGGRRDIDTCIFANKGSRWVHCGLSAFYSGYIIQDASATIVDAPLTLILRHGYDLVGRIFALKGRWWYDYRSFKTHRRMIFQGGMPQIVDAPLTLNFRA